MSAVVALDANVFVRRTRIIGTRLDIYSAWEPSTPFGGHSTITSEETPEGVKWFGRVGTERLPKELDALPARSEARFTAVREWQRNRYRRAYELIVAAFPEAAAGREAMGEIEVVAIA